MILPKMFCFLFCFLLILKNAIAKENFKPIRSVEEFERQTEEDQCEKYTECYSCSSPINGNNCLWLNGKCLRNPDVQNKEVLTWYHKLSQCQDNYSVEKSKKYCGKLTTEGTSTQIVNSHLFGQVSEENIFCIWKYAKKSKKTLKVKINKKNDSLLGLEVKKNEQTIYYDINEEKEFEEKFEKDYDIIFLYYFSDKIMEKEPFMAEFNLNKFYTFSQIALYLVIGIVLTFIVISLILLIFFCMKLLQRKKKGNFSKTQSYLKYSIRVEKYSEVSNLFSLNCPICLEDFKKSEKMAILECKHAFHSRCLFEWINKSPEKNVNCPICHHLFGSPKKEKEKKVILSVDINTNGNS